MHTTFNLVTRISTTLLDYTLGTVIVLGHTVLARRRARAAWLDHRLDLGIWR